MIILRRSIRVTLIGVYNSMRQLYTFNRTVLNAGSFKLPALLKTMPLNDSADSCSDSDRENDRDSTTKPGSLFSQILQNEVLLTDSFDTHFWGKIENEVISKQMRHVNTRWPLQMLSLLAKTSSVPTDKSTSAGMALLRYIETNKKFSNFLENRGVLLCRMLLISKDPTREPEVFHLFNKHFSNDCDMLDPSSAGFLITIFCNTSRWKESLRFIDSVRKFTNQVPSVLLKPILMTSLRNKDMGVFFNLLQICAMEEQLPADDVIIEFIQLCHTQEDFLWQFLKIVEDQGWVLSKPVCDSIKDCLERYTANGISWGGQFTVITKEGHCSACGEIMPRLERLADKDFEVLKMAVVDKALLKGDVFQGTTPEELETFKSFLHTHGPFDIVIDGLNTGYMKNHRQDNLQAAYVLSQVIKKLVYRHSMKVLVLGRKHMNKWPQEHMNYCRKMAQFFLTNDISKDDPYMLYAALSSGPHTYICTTDYLNDHAARLSHARHLFRHWQRGHQIVPDLVWFKRNRTEVDGRVKVMMPLVHDTRLKLTESSCHIPYNQEDLVSYKLSTNILCLKKH